MIHTTKSKFSVKIIGFLVLVGLMALVGYFSMTSAKKTMKTCIRKCVINKDDLPCMGFDDVDACIVKCSP